MSVAITLPFRVSEDGSIAVSEDLARKTADRLAQLVATSHYERPMRALYGSSAQNLVFNAVGSGIQLQTDIQSALQRFDPDINVGAVRLLSSADAADSAVVIQVQFSVPSAAPNITFAANISLAGEVTEVISRG